MNTFHILCQHLSILGIVKFVCISMYSFIIRKRLRNFVHCNKNFGMLCFLSLDIFLLSDKSIMVCFVINTYEKVF